MRTKINPNTAGNALIWVVLVITIMSLVAAELLRVVSSKYQNALHTSTWQESLVAAESGIDLAVMELRKTLYPAGDVRNDPWAASRGWDPNGFALNHGLTTIPNAGLAGTPMTVDVTVDAPPEIMDPENNWQYYRIRATGTMPITGPARAADNKQDTRLRKLSLRADRFTGNFLASQAVDSARVSRRIEAIVKPVSAFDQAIMAVGALDLNNSNIVIDSYDSRDPLKSRNGLYDVTRRTERGNIATDGAVLNAGGAYVYGDVATNAGVATNIQNITGIERTDFYQDPIPVGTPDWPSINPTPSVITNESSIAAGSVQGSPASRYVLSAISLNGNSRQALTISGNPDGSTSYVDIYVTGDISISGNGQIIIEPGVQARIYVAGNVSIAGNGVANQSARPTAVTFYGINPPDPTTSRTFNLGGNTVLSAAVYAPAYDVQINNSGNGGEIFGSFIGKTVRMVGTTHLHYDEALGAGGVINSYAIVSWFEDNR